MSDLKAAASRENGKKSHGPTTESGREKSSRNAIKHGIFSQVKVLDEESAEELEALLDALVVELDAVGLLEAHYVNEIAKVIFKKARLSRAETAAIQRERANILYASPDLQWADFSPTLVLTINKMPDDLRKELEKVRQELAIAGRTIPKDDEKFHRVAVSLDRELDRAVEALRKAQACRRALIEPVSVGRKPSSAGVAHNSKSTIADAELIDAESEGA